MSDRESDQQRADKEREERHALLVELRDKIDAVGKAYDLEYDGEEGPRVKAVMDSGIDLDDFVMIHAEELTSLLDALLDRATQSAGTRPTNAATQVTAEHDSSAQRTPRPPAVAAPMGAYELLSGEDIGVMRLALLNQHELYPLTPGRINRLCNMADNCILYAEEIQRLRAPQSARTSIIEECAKVCDALSEKWDTPMGTSTWGSAFAEAAKEIRKIDAADRKAKP